MNASRHSEQRGQAAHVDFPAFCCLSPQGPDQLDRWSAGDIPGSRLCETLAIRPYSRYRVGLPILLSICVILMGWRAGRGDWTRTLSVPGQNKPPNTTGLR